MTITWRVASLWDGRPAAPGEVVDVAITPRQGRWDVEVDAPLHRDPPPAGPGGPCWGLWEHEVVELFIAGPDGAYTEVELGPWGHHLVLRFREIRRPWARELPLELAVSRSEGRWRARAELPIGYLPPAPHRANAYAIHGVGSARRYLACWPSSELTAPDFHHLDAFHPLG